MPLESCHFCWSLLIVMFAVYLGQGMFYSRTLLSAEGEGSYLALGYLLVWGEISAVKRLGEVGLR